MLGIAALPSFLIWTPLGLVLAGIALAKVHKNAVPGQVET